MPAQNRPPPTRSRQWAHDDELAVSDPMIPGGPFTKVLVGVDGRQGGRDALALARQLVSVDGEMAPAHVWFIDPTAPMWGPQVEHTAQRERALERLASSLDGVDRGREIVSAAGASVGEGLHDLALERDADLIAIGVCGRSALNRLVVGDDARSVLEHAPCPVAVAPAGYAEHPAALLEIGVGYDDSPESKAALVVARKLAAACDASLSAFQAVSAPAFVPDPWDVEDRVDRSVEDARRRIAALGGLEARAACGSTVEQLALYGASVDLVVLGTRPHGRIGRLLRQSTSHRLVRSARFPLLVVPCIASAQLAPA